MKYIASVSFGKDSLAMLLILLSNKYPLDEVIFYDTGTEFNCIYEVRDKVKEMLMVNNIKFTELKPKDTFIYTMFEKPVKKRDGTISNGYSWCGGRCRWGTTEKVRTISNYLKSNYGENYKEYVGIAYDEPKRIKDDDKKIYPLYDLRLTEKECLNYCYDSGFTWTEDGINLYNILDRVSCWCCANKNLKELKNYFLYLPTYWNKLKELQSKTDRPMKYNKYSVFDLEEKFKSEVINENIKTNDN